MVLGATAAILALGSLSAAQAAADGPTACAGTAPVRAVDLVRDAARAETGGRVVLGCRLPAGRTVLDDGGVGAVVPAAGTTVFMNAMTGAGAQEFSVENRKDGTVVLGSVGAEPAVVGGAAPSREGGACSDGAHKGEGYVERDNLQWWINTHNLPAGISANDAVLGFRNAMNYFIAARTDCAVVPRYTNPPRATYRGLTQYHGNITADAVCDIPNSHSTISFDTLNRSDLMAKTCTWVYDNDVYESDTELNRRKSWFVNPPANCYDDFDIAGVTMHEIGHTFGLDHPDGPHYDLTMSSKLFDCTTYYRTLGLGDLAALDTLY